MGRYHLERVICLQNKIREEKKAYGDGEEAAIALDNARVQLEKPIYNQKGRQWRTLPAALPKSSQWANLTQGLHTGPLI